MKMDRPYKIAMKIVRMCGDTEAYRDAVAAIARVIRAEVKHALAELEATKRKGDALAVQNEAMRGADDGDRTT